MDESDSKIKVSSFFERVDSIDKVANSALSKSKGNFDIINNQKALINSINVSIEALETKVRDIANFIIIEKKLEKDAEEDRLFEQQDESQKGSMLERLAGLKPNNESEQTQAAGGDEEPKKGGGGILGTLLTLGIGAFALKFLWPAILPAVGGLLKGALAKFAMFSIGGIGSLIKSIIVATGLTGIGVFGIGKMFQKFGDSAENRGNKIAKSAADAINKFKFNKDGKVDGAESLNVEGGSEGGGEDGGNGGGLNEAEDYKAQEEYYQSEEYLSTLNEEGIGTSYEDMKKTLEKKDLIKKTEDLTIEQLERKITVSENKIASMMQSGSNEELIEFENDKIELLKEAIERKKSGMEVTATRTYTIDNEIENKNIDLSLNDSFSEKFEPLNNQVDMLSEDFTGSINTESGQMFSRPANSPNTTVTVIKQPTSNTPITNLMRNNYLSLNKKQQTELLKYIK